MGVDITMKLIDKNGNELINRLYDGRNSEWFANLQERNWDTEYEYLPKKRGVPEYASQNIKDDVAENCFYGFFYMSYKDYKEWFLKYRPDLDAGWVSTYDKWRVENKGYTAAELFHELPEDARIEDMHFVEVVNEWDPNRSVLNKIENWLLENKRMKIKEEDLMIVYYFDC